MSKKKSGKKRFLKNIVTLLAILFVAGIGYIYITEVEEKDMMENQAPRSASRYQMLENPDSSAYLAKILVEQNISILQLAKTFYKNDMYWPYIFNTNTKVGNILDISPGTIISIPRIDSSLLDVTDKENSRFVKRLGDSILNEVSKQREISVNEKVSDF